MLIASKSICAQAKSALDSSILSLKYAITIKVGKILQIKKVLSTSYQLKNRGDFDELQTVCLRVLESADKLISRDSFYISILYRQNIQLSTAIAKILTRLKFK